MDRHHTKAAKATFAPDHLDLVRMIAMRGATDEELAQNFGVAPAVFRAWKSRYPSFKEAIEKGRTRADAEVLVGLYQRCVGYDYVEEQAVGGRSPEVLEVQRHAPPSVEGAKAWLAARQSEHWNTRVSVEHGGRPDAPIGLRLESRDAIIDSILDLIANKPDGVTKPEQRK